MNKFTGKISLETYNNQGQNIKNQKYNYIIRGIT